MASDANKYPDCDGKACKRGEDAILFILRRKLICDFAEAALAMGKQHGDPDWSSHIRLVLPGLSHVSTSAATSWYI